MTHYRGLLIAGLTAVALTSGCSSELPRNVAPDLETVRMIQQDLQKLAGGGAEGVATGATVAQPTGWATLRGVFRINGSPPQLAPLQVNRDGEICGTTAANQAVVVNGDRLQYVLLYLATDIPDDADAAEPKWVHPDYLATREAELVFDQKNCVFLSHVFAMRSTQAVRILNSDPIGHNTNIAPSRGATPFNQTIAGNTKQESAPTYRPGGVSPQPFPVSCSIHPWMSAWMITCGNPYFAVTDEEGQFEIPNVPAGVELEFRVWQEKAGFVDAVTVNGQSQSWPRGRLLLTLEPGEMQDLEVVVDAAKFQ